jgi:hypothetical protein
VPRRYAPRRQASTRVSQPPIWFQLAKFRVTTRLTLSSLMAGHPQVEGPTRPLGGETPLDGSIVWLITPEW